MGALAGFLVGYYFGTRDGREGFQRLVESWEYVSQSEEFKALLMQGTTLASGLLKQGLSRQPGGNLYPVLAEGVVDLIARRRAA